MSKIYGYARVSTNKQSIERQIDNIKRYESRAVIIEEEFTGTTTDRPKLNKLIKNIKADDAIIFDEVSRMSRNATEGIELYEQLFDKGVNLVFIKEPHINTSVYRGKLNKQIEKLTSTGSKATDKLLESIMTALHEYTIDIAKEQIEIAFRTAQAEVDFLHQRTSEGVRKAQERYIRETALGLEHEKQQVGRVQGVKVETKKSRDMKVRIIELSRDFNGKNKDEEVISILKIAHNTYYKYKREIKATI